MKFILDKNKVQPFAGWSVLKNIFKKLREEKKKHMQELNKQLYLCSRSVLLYWGEPGQRSEIAAKILDACSSFKKYSKEYMQRLPTVVKQLETDKHLTEEKRHENIETICDVLDFQQAVGHIDAIRAELDKHRGASGGLLEISIDDLYKELRATRTALHEVITKARKLRNLEGADPRDEFRKSLGMLLITLTTFFSGQQYSMFQVHADNYFKHFQAEDLKWWIDLFSPMASLILMTGVYFLSQKSFRVGYMTSLGLSFLSSFLYFLAYDTNSVVLLCMGLLLTNQCAPLVLCRLFISRYLNPQDRTRSSGTLTAAYFIGLGVGYFIAPSFLKSSRELVNIHINSLNSGSFMLSIFWLALILLAYTQKYTSKSILKPSDSTTSGYVEAFLYITYAVGFYNIILFTHPECLAHQIEGTQSTIYLWSGLLPMLTSPVYVILYASSFFLDDNTLLISGLALAAIALGIMVVNFAKFWFIIGCILLYIATHISLSAVLAIGLKTSHSGRVALILSLLAVVFDNAGRYAGDFNAIGFRITGLTFAVGVLLWGIFLFKNLNSNLKA